MSLLQFFHLVKAATDDDEDGREKSCVPSKLVQDGAPHVVCLVKERGKRGEYLKLTPKEKATIGKYASEHGVASAVKKFKKKNLKECSVRDWRDAYLREFNDKLEKAKPGEEVSFKELCSKKRERPVLLGVKMDECLQQLLLWMRSRGTPVGTTVVIGAAQGILMNHKSKGNSEIRLNKEWARSLLCRIGFTKRNANSKLKVLPENFYKIKEQFLIDVRSVIKMEDVPPSLVLNWDHTAIKIVPSSNWTMEKKGTKRVEIAAIDDKRQITALFACTISGNFLPMQLIYKGTTTKCLPKLKDEGFSSDWHITYTANHWANEVTTIAYLEKVIIPYVKREREAKAGPDPLCSCIV